MVDQVRLALVGCGGISAAHVRGYKDLHERGSRDMLYTACCDASEESAQQRAQEIADIQGYEPAVFTDMEHLIQAKAADGADICLPHWLHHSAAIRLMEEGWHALVEKPLGITVRASERMIETAQRTHRILATAENVRRYAPARAFRWAISEQKLIGDVQAADVYWVNHRPMDINRPSARWRLVKLLTGGGMIMDSGAHFADMMLYLFGAPEEIHCTMSTHDRRVVEHLPVLGSAPVDVEDAWHILIRFQGGLVVSWTYSRAFPAPGMEFGRYYGSQGLIEDASFVFHCFQKGGTVRYPDESLLSTEEVVERYKASLAPEQEARIFPYGCEDGFGVEIWDFCRAIRTGQPPELDGEAGLRAKALCECCYESAEAGRPMRYADVLSGAVRTYQEPIDAYWGI